MEFFLFIDDSDKGQRTKWIEDRKKDRRTTPNATRSWTYTTS